jgi:lipopolysaccharide biosynthesis glycosyltransferase
VQVAGQKITGAAMTSDKRNISATPDETGAIHIALGANSRFAPGLLVTAASIAAQASGDRLVFHIMDSGLSHRDRDDLKSVLSDIRPKAQICYLKIDTGLFKGLPPWRGGYSAYERLLLHEALPDVDYIVYSDVDTYWGRDVAELWAMREPNHSIWAASDSLDCDRGNAYFCSGVYLMNLQRLREIGFTAKMIEYASSHELVFPDQDILNAMLGPESVLLSSVWDMQEAAEWNDAFAEPCVIHYTRNKPWLNSTRSPVNFVTQPWWDFFFQWIGVQRRPETADIFKKRRFKAWVYSHPGFLALYCRLRRLPTLKRKRLEHLFLSTSLRNRSPFWTKPSPPNR